MASSRHSQPLGGFGRVASVSSSVSSGHHGQGGGGLARTATMTTVSGNVRWKSDTSRSQFQDELHGMAAAVGIPLALPRSLLSLPHQRATPMHDSDSAGAEELLKSLRPKRVLLGKSSKGFTRDEVLFALEKAVESKRSALIIESLLKLAGSSAGDSASTFTADKKGHTVPTLDTIFNKAEYSGTFIAWRLFLSRVSQRALDTSLSTALKDRPNDIERVKSLLEYGANPELCQDRILDLIAIGSEEIIELLLLSPRLNNVEFLSHGLVKAARSTSLRNVCMLLLRGANANFSQADALKIALSEKNYDSALAIVTITKTPISSSNLDDATGLIGTWNQESQKHFLKMLIYAGASGPRTSKILIPFIQAHEEEIICDLIECPAFRHSTFPAPNLFEYAIFAKDFGLALEIMRSSAKRSLADYAATGVHLQLVKSHAENAENLEEIISELLQLGSAGDYASQMLVSCCAPEQIESPRIMSLVDLLIDYGGAKVSYSDGAALFLAIKSAHPEMVAALIIAKPTKKILSSAISHASSCLTDDNPSKLEILTTLLDAGASGQSIDRELVSAVDKTAFSLGKVRAFLKSASLDYSDGAAIVRAVELERFDILEIMFAMKPPQYLIIVSIWKQIRKLFALAQSEEGHLPYNSLYMLKVFELLHASAKEATPINELLLDATQCASKDASLTLSRLFLRWGASPNHALGSPLQACVKRFDTKTLAVLLAVETSKTSLKYAFQEALLLGQYTRRPIIQMMINAGLEGASLDAALPQILKEEPYDKPTVHLIVEAGARLHSGFGQNLVTPSKNLDLQVVEKLLSTVVDKDSLILPLRAVLTSHPDWHTPESRGLPMVKLLVSNCIRGPWADELFLRCVKLWNQHAASVFAEHLTSDSIYSDALNRLLTSDASTLSRDKLLMSQYLLSNGASGSVVDDVFMCAAKDIDYEWVSALYPHLFDPSVALSAFDVVMNSKEVSGRLQKNRSDIIQFLLEQGIEGSVVDGAFVKAASAADLKGMNQLLHFVSSKDAFSDSLGLLALQEDLLISREGLTAAKILVSKGVSDSSAMKSARVAAKARNLEGVKLILDMTPKDDILHAAYEGFMDHTDPLSHPGSHGMITYLLQTGLCGDDAKRIASLAASKNDIDILKAMGPLENSRELYDSAANTIDLTGDAWLTPERLEFVGYLLSRGISAAAIHRLIEAAARALNLPALRMLLSVSDEEGIELAFTSVTVVDDERWTSPEGLQVVTFLLEQGAKGLAVEEAAAHAAKTANYEVLEMFLKSSAAARTIPAAFKALTRGKAGQMSSEQLNIASALVKHGVSTEVLAIAAIEMAKLLDIEGLKVLSRASHFHQIADDVLRAILLSEDLWASPYGIRITHFLLNEGVTSQMFATAASKAAASLNIDVLRQMMDSNCPPAVVESAFTSMTGLEKRWLCPEGLRIADFLLQRKPSQGSINRAFIQATQYLNFDAVQLLHPYIQENSVFGEALHRAVGNKSEWLSALHIVQLILNSGVEGDAVEFALIEGARALNLDSLKLLTPKIDYPDVYTKAFAAATESNQDWRNCLPVVEILLQHGAKGEPIEQAYVAAAAALDLKALTILNPFINNRETPSHAFRAMIANSSWSASENLDVLGFLYFDGIASKDIEIALVSAAHVLNVAAVQLLSRHAEKEVCAKAFAAATKAPDVWTSSEGTKVVTILAQKGAHGESMENALITCSRLSRLDLVTKIAENIDNKDLNCVSQALDALLEVDGSDPFSPDGLGILRILISKGASGNSAKGALVRAATLGNKTALEVLAPIVDDPQTYSQALNALTSSNTMWLDKDLELIGILLSHGASGEGLQHALVSAVTHIIDGSSSKELLELLLKHGADVNFDHGKAFELAVQHERYDILDMLLLESPDSHTLYTGLKAALCNGLGEETVFRLFKVVTGNEAVRAIPDMNNNSELGFPLLFYCLNNYPASVRLTREICGLKADLSATILWEAGEDEYDNPQFERLPPLFIALKKKCTDKVIEILLTFGANVNFIPDQSQTSALMLAAAEGRSSTVSSLLDHGANVYQKDVRDRTPLCYAARSGDLASLKSILKKNPPRNDGSLHEAARELHASAVRLLIESNHDINFPSSRHGGRSPLCELCYACKGFKDPVGLQNTLTELHNAKAEPLRKSRGRTAIFMAMENANPIPVVTALIEACLWKDLNDPQNVYEEGDHFYSSTMYIKKGIIRQTEAVAMELLEKLQDFNATDRYYAKERMPQPRDAVGMPQRILDFDHKKWIRSSRLEEEEQDFERKLKRQEQEMANRQILSQRQHLMVLEQRENMGQQQSAHALDTHLLSMKLKDREHAMGLDHQEEAYDHRLGEMSSGNILKMNMEAAQHATKFNIEKERWEARLLHESQARELDIGYLGKEQGVRYTGLEAQQNLRLEGISSELELKRQQQMDELRYRESRSGVDRAELDHKLQFTNQLNSGRVQMNRDMRDLDFEVRRNRNLLEDQNRQSQQHHQFTTDQGRINTQMAMNQQEYARNQDSLSARWTQGQIDMSTRAGLGQIERDNMQERIQMTQQDRGHQLDTEHRMGQIQNQNMQGRLGLEFNHLRATNHEKLGFQQAVDQQRLGYQQDSDYQKLATLDTEGRIQNSALRDQHLINLDYQHQSGNMQLGQQATARRIELDHSQQSGNMVLGQQLQSKTLELNYEQRRLGQQAVGNSLQIQRQDAEHQTRMEDYRAQDYLNTQRVKGAVVMGQVRKEESGEGNRAQEQLMLEQRRFKQLEE